MQQTKVRVGTATDTESSSSPAFCALLCEPRGAEKLKCDRNTESVFRCSTDLHITCAVPSRLLVLVGLRGCAFSAPLLGENTVLSFESAHTGHVEFAQLSGCMRVRPYRRSVRFVDRHRRYHDDGGRLVVADRDASDRVVVFGSCFDVVDVDD
jgi:hypothetical protein